MSPYDLLQIDADADDAGVRAAYLAALRRYPPIGAPEMFSRITSAYEQIATAEQRYHYALWGKPAAVPGGPLAQALDYARVNRRRPQVETLRAAIKKGN